MLGIVGAHGAAQRGGDLIVAKGPDLLLVKAAIEEMRVDPAAAAFKQAMALSGEIRFADSARHFLAGAQSGQIVDTALRIGAVKFDVVGIVLDAFEDAIAIGVPTARNPGEC